MSSMQSEVYTAFRTLNIPEQEALAAAAALSRRDNDVSSLRGEMRAMQALLGVNTAMLVALLLKLFVHG